MESPETEFPFIALKFAGDVIPYMAYGKVDTRIANPGAAAPIVAGPGMDTFPFIVTCALAQQTKIRLTSKVHKIFNLSPDRKDKRGSLPPLPELKW